MARTRTTWTRDQAAANAGAASLRAALTRSAQAGARARAAANLALGIHPAAPGRHPAPITTLARAVADAVAERAETAPNGTRSPSPSRRRSRPAPAPLLEPDYAEPAVDPAQDPTPRQCPTWAED